MRTEQSLVSRLNCGALLLGSALAIAGSGCSEPVQTAKPTPTPYNKPEKPVYETPTVENTEERAEDVRKVCNRKAQTSSDLSRCWMQESERIGAKKFDAEIRVNMLIGPDGHAQEASVMNPSPRKELEACVLEAVKGWSYPSGQTVVPAQCTFILRPIM